MAEELCRLFAEDKSVDMTPILRRSKEAARLGFVVFFDFNGLPAFLVPVPGTYVPLKISNWQFSKKNFLMYRNVITKLPPGVDFTLYPEILNSGPRIKDTGSIVFDAAY